MDDHLRELTRQHWNGDLDLLVAPLRPNRISGADRRRLFGDQGTKTAEAEDDVRLRHKPEEGPWA